jgi:Flp pilus assembly protein TadD
MLQVMSSTKQDSSPDHEGKRPQRGDYLYHIQSPGRSSRREPEPLAQRRQRRHTFQNAAEEELYAHLRKFAVFAGIMIVLLTAAVYIASKAWDIKHAAQSKSAREQRTTTAPSLSEESLLSEETSTVPAETLDVFSSEEDPEVQARMALERARVLVQSGAYDEAIVRYREALALAPDLEGVHGRLGNTLLREGHTLEAAGVLEKAAEREPDNAYVLNDLGIAYLYAKRFGEAEEMFARAISLESAFAESYLNLARAQMAQSNMDKARETLDESLQAISGDVRILKEKAYLDAVAGRYDEALAGLDEALEQEPEWIDLHLDKASILALQGQHDNALEALSTAEQLSSPGHVYRVYLQPAFRNLRRSEQGQAFERQLAGRAREFLNQQRGQDQKQRYRGEPIGAVFYSP